MQTLPISAVKARLSELVDSAASTRDEVAITVNGSPAAMLVGIDEWEEIQERLYWLANGEGLAQDIAKARAEAAAGEGAGEDEIRARFGVPKR
ncbi:type II toxin-antitoxin system Phd/YefM family antitoxin [Diaminobutyricibacter tongyongensis]|uniref:Antitoxin n=1 Tax=Leifsonia tongyongensis TaxID=1268043 RepID=A0A6L9XUR8_9MICO|nr:type II toxin-antitoxin system Phd/YefM family antitoxin [Diaminobutyricibacter tongyongensis]NEN05151.1 type II toxin-antitoxin system Phd/YefM family antitoxin [Diaminobutyricibacter tongyongensis]